MLQTSSPILKKGMRQIQTICLSTPFEDIFPSCERIIHKTQGKQKKKKRTVYKTQQRMQTNLAQKSYQDLEIEK
jgi:hypothetical protein